MKVFGAMSIAYLSQARPQRFVRRWAVKEWLAQRAEVKARAANQQSRMATLFYLFDLFNCGSGPVRGRKIHQRGDGIDQVMRYTATLFQRHFCRGDLNSLIDLYGVTVDDLTTNALRQRDSQLALTGSGRANYGNDGSADILSAFFDFVLCFD